MKKQSNALKKPTLSPIMDENEEQQKSWAITQQHGRGEARAKQQKQGVKSKSDGGNKGEGGITALPVLGSFLIKT